MLLTRNLLDKYYKKLLDTTARVELDAAKVAYKKVVHKTDEVRGELTGKNCEIKTYNR